MIRSLLPSQISFRWHLISSVAIVHFVMMGIFVFDLVQTQKNFLRSIANEQAVGLVRTLSFNSRLWLLTNDVSGLAEVVNSLSSTPDLLFAMVMSPNGKVLAGTDPSLAGKILDDPVSSRILSYPPSQTQPVILLDNASQVDVATPIFAGSERIGWARLSTSRQSIYSGLADVWRTGALFTFLAILIGSIFAILIAKRLAFNLLPLLNAFSDVQSGKTPRPIPPSRIYEIEVLRTGFCSMRNSIESERELRENALQEAETSRERFFLAINGSNDGIWDWDLESNALFLSPKWKEMIGFSDSELPNEFASFSTRIHPDDKSLVMDSIQKYLAGEISEHRVEFRFLHKKGHWIWILGRGSALYTPQGKPYRMAGSHTDISATKEAEILLRNEHQRLTSLLEGIGEPIYVLDPQTKTFLYANPSFKAIWQENIEGKFCHELLFDLPSPCDVCSSLCQKTDHSPQALVWEIPMKNGRTYRLSSRKISWTKDTDALFHLAIDITERHEAEEKIRSAKEQLELSNTELRISIEKTKQLASKADAASRAKSEFLANISHEIRTPMNSILGFADILSFSLSDPHQKQQAQNIVRSARSLILLLTDILDFSKIESGFALPKNAPLSLPSLLEDIRLLFSSKAKEKGLSFLVSSEESVPELIFSDELRLRQILINLTSNAIKFTHSGSVALSISLAPHQNGTPPSLLFRISDTGIGIPPEIRNSIFEVFFQAPGLDHAAYGGTGLGLAISKQIAEMLGGSLSVSDNPAGAGSLFSLAIPITTFPENSTPSPHLFLSSSSDISFEKAKILIAEEITTHRELLRSYLEQLGFDVLEASSGFQTLALIQKHTPDLLIAAIDMKGMNASELRRHLQTTPFQNIPVIAIANSPSSPTHPFLPEETLVFPLSLSFLISTLSPYLPQSTSSQNLSASDHASPGNISPDDCRKLLPSWESTLSESCANARKSMRMTSVKDFAELLLQVAQEQTAPTLEITAQNLLAAAQKFEIEKMIALFDQIFESFSTAKEPLNS